MSNDLHGNIKVSKCTVIYLNLCTILGSHMNWNRSTQFPMSIAEQRLAQWTMGIVVYLSLFSVPSVSKSHLLNYMSYEPLERKFDIATAFWPQGVSGVSWHRWLYWGEPEATRRRNFWGTLVFSPTSSNRDNSANLEFMLQKHAGSLVLSLVLFYLVVR